MVLCLSPVKVSRHLPFLQSRAKWWFWRSAGLRHIKQRLLGVELPDFMSRFCGAGHWVLSSCGSQQTFCTSHWSRNVQCNDAHSPRCRAVCACAINWRHQLHMCEIGVHDGSWTFSVWRSHVYKSLGLSEILITPIYMGKREGFPADWIIVVQLSFL